MTDISRHYVARQPGSPVCQAGYSLVELLLALVLAVILLAALGGVVGQVTQTHDQVTDRHALNRQARFAMEQMVRTVSQSRLLLLPMADIPATTLNENIREQTNPPSTPPDGSVLATAVLAVVLPATFDLDGNDIPDADNDGDGLIDEDLPADITNDGKPGIWDIDDDGNGVKDFNLSPVADDDESGDLAENEDAINGLDDDGDGNVDEDPDADNNGDGCPGACGVDDDGDGVLDEGAVADDDEDGSSDEDWYDPVVFYLAGDALVQRTPVPWDEDGSGTVTGQDVIVETIADNVTRFQVERLPRVAGGEQLVELVLELTAPVSGETVSLNTRVRVGGAL